MQDSVLARQLQLQLEVRVVDLQVTIPFIRDQFRLRPHLIIEREAEIDAADTKLEGVLVRIYGHLRVFFI